ncbi:superoxide dismutase family protein [Pseudofulvimonas gallinarii]|jgi:Cu-Zn family superoxide dismutase|uniref:Superoxide dismutase [Cu-Zn] n=1 Tax=Pseudofulvimonas gallinarii TaxID=634155 RepID=A0A4R3LK79_9GAMM|nr:superoxide dismutase family protein [Pseudofulvimonas gallinarii]TCT00261.1 Cu-Zn family superoxide dismutase [Pseudofulvimonas gallinarii]THD14106.1 hypothetical protein B1808_04510 [Pseudofulvimonas gallinarii]
MRIAVLLPLSLASLGLAGTLSAQQVPAEKPQINRVTVELASASGQRATGTIVLSPDNHGLHLTGTVRGLKANSEHGFHVHENGDCSAADASSAGAHFNPAGSDHGRHGQGAHHAGDLPNIKANAQGEATVDLHVTGLTLGDGGRFDILDRALVVHADADDYTSQPAGNAGSRIACGVITRPEPPQLPAPPATEGEEAAETTADTPAN